MSVWGYGACAALATIALGVAVTVLWPWRIEASVKATTRADAISLGGGLDVGGLSASAAAILGGPGVLALHFRARELLRRTTPAVTVEALLAWLETRLSSPKKPAGVASRIAARVKDWLLPRTDLVGLPDLAIGLLLGLRDVRLDGALTLGFSDPILTGKAAAWLFPIAGVLSPYGILDVRFDWTGKNRFEGAASFACRVALWRVAVTIARFAWRYVHPFRSATSVSSTLASPVTPMSGAAAPR